MVISKKLSKLRFRYGDFVIWKLYINNILKIKMKKNAVLTHQYFFYFSMSFSYFNHLQLFSLLFFPDLFLVWYQEILTLTSHLFSCSCNTHNINRLALCTGLSVVNLVISLSLSKFSTHYKGDKDYNSQNPLQRSQVKVGQGKELTWYLETEIEREPMIFKSICRTNVRFIYFRCASWVVHTLVPQPEIVGAIQWHPLKIIHLSLWDDSNVQPRWKP